MPTLPQILVWTPNGLMSLRLSDRSVTAASTPSVLRAQITEARQLWHDRVVGLTGNVVNYTGKPAAGRLVSFSPSNPGNAVDLGDATSWFPSFDGTGVWRVLQRSGGPPSLDSTSVFEATPFGLDGQPRGTVITFAGGRLPVAATSDGLAVEQPAPPDRPYPAGLGRGPRTAVGGVVADLVRFNLGTAQLAGHISDYTRVSLAEPQGVALVTNSDPNVQVRATEVINLDTGQPTRQVDSRPELRWLPLPQPRTFRSGGAVGADTRGARTLFVSPLSGKGIEISSDLVPATTPDNVLRIRQEFIWVGDDLLFPEGVGEGVKVAAWSQRSRTTLRSSVLLPPGSYPVGGSV